MRRYEDKHKDRRQDARQQPKLSVYRCISSPQGQREIPAEKGDWNTDFLPVHQLSPIRFSSDWQDAEKVIQRRSRIPQRLNVPPGKSCQRSSGRAG